MRITNSNACPTADCPVDLAPNCTLFPLTPTKSELTNARVRPGCAQGTIRQLRFRRWLQERLLRKPRREPGRLWQLLQWCASPPPHHYQPTPLTLAPQARTAPQRRARRRRSNTIAISVRPSRYPLRVSLPTGYGIPQRTTARMRMHTPTTRAAERRSGCATRARRPITP